MKPSAIISRAQSLRILRNDLRKAALARRAVELDEATSEGRKTILAEIDREIEREVKKSATELGRHNVIY